MVLLRVTTLDLVLPFYFALPYFTRANSGATKNTNILQLPFRVP